MAKRNGSACKKTVVDTDEDEHQKVITDNPFFGQILADYQGQVRRCTHHITLDASIPLYSCSLMLFFSLRG